MVLALALQVVLELTGLVLGPDGKPLARATVQAGAVSTRTDAQGRFRLQVPEGATDVRISGAGLEPQVRALKAGTPLLVRLEPKAAEAVVEIVDGSGYGSEGTPQSALTKLDIYLTPGAAADVFQATKALPGVSQATEGAELYVRGGTPDEVGIFLNGGHLRQPFHHPSAQGGIFSAVDTALVTRVTFIPGGFSARYGDALSAVLDMAADDAPVRAGGTMVLNPATQTMQADQPMGGGLLRGSTRYANSRLLDRWFNLSRTFQEAPVSTDAHLAWQGPTGSVGRLSVLALGSRDHLGVDTRIANLDDTYRNRSTTDYLSATWTGDLGPRALATVSGSASRHHHGWTFGPWGLTQEERASYQRAEVLWTPTEALALETGLEGEQVRLSPSGAVPLDPADWTPGRPARTFAYAFDGMRRGLYATLRWRLQDAWGLSLGARTDRYGLLDERTHDLRATLSWQIAPRTVLRAAYGTFHQAPPMTDLDPHMGNPDLKTQRATHALMSLETRGEADAWQVRLEAYRKAYDRLVTEPALGTYLGDGEGRATGLDLLVKGGRGPFRGWIGYGWLSTRRREGRQLTLGPVPTSIPHNLTAVLTWTPKVAWDLSAAWRQASGAPFTPILGGKPDPLGGWTPLEGPRYNDRLPTYGRMDLRATHLFSTGPFRVAAYLEVMNLLNRRNLAGYSWSPDYTTRRDEPSYFARRILVGGVTLMW